MLLVFPFDLPIINAIIDTYTHIHRLVHMWVLPAIRMFWNRRHGSASYAHETLSLLQIIIDTSLSNCLYLCPPPSPPLSCCLTVCQIGGLARKCIAFIWISISPSKHISIFICTLRIRLPLTPHIPAGPHDHAPCITILGNCQISLASLQYSHSCCSCCCCCCCCSRWSDWIVMQAS